MYKVFYLSYRLDRVSIRSSQRYGLSPPYRLTKEQWNSNLGFELGWTGWGVGLGNWGLKGLGLGLDNIVSL